MRDKNNREALVTAQFRNFLDDFTLYNNVQRRGRFIHNNQLRLKSQSHGNHHTLTHAAGKFKRVSS